MTHQPRTLPLSIISALSMGGPDKPAAHRLLAKIRAGADWLTFHPKCDLSHTVQGSSLVVGQSIQVKAVHTYSPDLIAFASAVEPDIPMPAPGEYYPAAQSDAVDAALWIRANGWDAFYREIPGCPLIPIFGEPASLAAPTTFVVCSCDIVSIMARGCTCGGI